VRVAALYDIHGNLPALEAVLQEIRSAAVDLVVVGGDVLPGPMPGETLDCLEAFEIPARFIQGNGDREVLAVLAGTQSTAVPEAYRPVMQWVAERLQPEHVRRIASWPQTVTIDVPGLGQVLFCHATPRSDSEVFTRLTPPAKLALAFDGLTERTVVCGHTHMQFELSIAGVRIFNAGSVGMPFGAPGAYWLVLDATTVQFRRTAYDLSAAAARIRTSGYPQAADFADRNVLRPPPEEQMLEAFTRASER
jgi:predicted phosphodiesterase